MMVTHTERESYRVCISREIMERTVQTLGVMPALLCQIGSTDLTLASRYASSFHALKRALCESM